MLNSAAVHHNPRRLGPNYAEQCCSAPQSEAIRTLSFQLLLSLWNRESTRVYFLARDRCL